MSSEKRRSTTASVASALHAAADILSKDEGLRRDDATTDDDVRKTSAGPRPMSPRSSGYWWRNIDDSDETGVTDTDEAEPGPNVEASYPPDYDRQFLGEVREQFSYFDYDNDGEINHTELAMILRCRGFNPSDAELASLIDQYDTKDCGRLNFKEFMTMLPHVKNSEDNFGEMYEAFRTFDKNDKGYIKSGQLKTALMTHGEKLSEEEANELISFALNGATEGNIYYGEFIETLLGKEKEKK